MKTVLINIILARTKKGYLQDYMAKRLNISQSAYHKLERGYTKLTVYRLKKIALILNVDVCSLMG